MFSCRPMIYETKTYLLCKISTHYSSCQSCKLKTSDLCVALSFFFFFFFFFFFYLFVFCFLLFVFLLLFFVVVVFSPPNPTFLIISDDKVPDRIVRLKTHFIMSLEKPALEIIKGSAPQTFAKFILRVLDTLGSFWDH